MSHTLHSRIMITSGGGPGVWGLLHAMRTLPGRTATIVVQDADANDTFGTCMGDVAANLPPAADSTYVDSLIEYCRHGRVDLLVPVFDGELTNIARRRGDFARVGTHVLLPPSGLVATCANKWRLHERLADVGFLPDFSLVRCLDETESAIGELGYPERTLCVRPVDLAGGRGLHFLDPRADLFEQRLLSKPGPTRCTADEFLRVRRAGPAEFPLVISEYLPGDDLGIDLLADQGRVVELVVRRKAGPLFHGNPMRMEFDERAGEREWATRLTAELNLSGLLNIDARYDARERLRLIEINPRPSACIGMSCARVHLPAWAIDLALQDRDIDPAEYYSRRPARRVVRALADVAVNASGARLVSPELRSISEINDHASALPCGTS